MRTSAGVLLGLLCSVGLLTGSLSGALPSAQAATMADLDQAIVDLGSVVPDLSLRVELERTFSRAIIREEGMDAVLKLDPIFMEQLSSTGLLFVVAHEYAHIHLNHQQALGDLALELSGLDNTNDAFDSLEYRPTEMAKLHAMNRRHELEADQIASKWLRQLGLNPCDSEVLRSIDNGGLVFTVVPSHPGFHERRRVICPTLGKPKPFTLLPGMTPHQH